MSAPELKPCPFCGGEAEMIVPRDGKNPYVMCTQNYCTQPHPDCVERWNTRADLCDPLQDERVKELVEAGEALAQEMEFRVRDLGSPIEIERSVMF
jgi:hypothetical protein